MGNKDATPPNIMDPVSKALFGVLCGAGIPLSKVNSHVETIKKEAKSVHDLNRSITDLNSTLQDTNNILREFLEKF